MQLRVFVRPEASAVELEARPKDLEDKPLLVQTICAVLRSSDFDQGVVSLISRYKLDVANRCNVVQRRRSIDLGEDVDFLRVDPLTKKIKTI